MTGIIDQLLQCPMGVGLMVLMGLVMLTFFLWYGFFVIALPSVSATSLVRNVIVRYQEKKAMEVKVMKYIITVIAIAALVAKTTPSLAFSGQETMGTSLLVILFLGLGALIIVGQSIPGLMLFYSMMKGLFSKAVKKLVPLPDEREEKERTIALNPQLGLTMADGGDSIDKEKKE